MARITQAQVDEAANLFLTRGQEPTLRLVQESIGSGSYTTIKAMLEHWRQNKVAAPDVPIPDAVVGRGQELVRLVWSEACRLCEERIQEIEQAGQRERGNIVADLNLAEQTIDNLEQQNATLLLQLTDHHHRTEILERERNEALVQAQVALARAGELEQQRDDLRSQLASVEAQVRDLGSLRDIRDAMASQAAAFNDLARFSVRRKTIAEREKAERDAEGQDKTSSQA